MDHPIHHLADAEAMAEVVEGVATVVLLDAQLLKKSTLFNLLLYSFFFINVMDICKSYSHH